MDATLSALVCVETLVQEAVKNHACTHVREHVETVAETVVSLHVREIVAVLVLGHRFNHVKTALVHVHLPAKAVVVHLVLRVAKVHANHHVLVIVTLDVKMAANQDVKELVVPVARDLVILVVKKPVKTGVRGLAKAIVPDHVLDHVKTHVKALVTLVVILLAWGLVLVCVCIVADGDAQVIFITKLNRTPIL